MCTCWIQEPSTLKIKLIMFIYKLKWSWLLDINQTLSVFDYLHVFFHFILQNTKIEDDPYVPTSEDLAGFWDMVHIQVVHIHTLFAEMVRCQKNGWKRVEVSFFQSICVQQILAHPQTPRTIAFCSTHSHTARVCFLKNFPRPHTSLGP